MEFPLISRAQDEAERISSEVSTLLDRAKVLGEEAVSSAFQSASSLIALDKLVDGEFCTKKEASGQPTLID